MNKEELKIILEKHKKWLNKEEGWKIADLSGADLSYADLCGAKLNYADLCGAKLSYADLSGADLSDANLDYSSGIPLHCGGSHFKTCLKNIYQYLVHVATIQCDEPEWEQIKAAIMPFAVKSHRARDLGLLETQNEKEKPND